jgi:cytochrome b subunit of formate dehydrogenase
LAVFVLVILHYVIFGPKRKVFFWFILLMVGILGTTGLIIIWARDGNLRLIAHPIHNLAAFIGIIAVIVHAYLGSLANPGTLRGIFEGEN